MSEARSDAQRRLQRSPRFVATFALVAVVWAATTSWAPVAKVLGVRGHDMWILSGAATLALTSSAIAFRAFGPRDRRYLLVAVIEAFTYAVSMMTAVYRTRPDSIVWVAYVVGCALNATISDQRAALRVGASIPPLALALVYLAVDHDPAAAGISVVAGGFAILAFEVQASTAARLDARTEAFEAAQRELADLRLTKDRERIARDLHDGLGADLTAIAWRAERLLAAEEVSGAELRTIATRATQGIDDLRTVVWALKEPSRGWAEVCAYVRGRVSELATETTEVLVEADTSPRLLSGEEASHVVRAVEEAVRNAVRHADATRVVVRLEGSTALRVVVEDDGKGLPEGPGRRSGMQHLETRAKALGLSMRVESGATGTRIVME